MAKDTRPTLDTVAQAAGVSRMTVSNAYNRPDQLSAATRERVLAVAAQLGYPGPNPAARSLRLGRAGTIGVLLTERLPYAFTDPGMVAIMRGMAIELGAEERAMLLVPSEAADVAALVRSAVVDAFIVVSLEADDEAVRAVIDRRLPMVTVGQPRIAGTPFVGIDNAAAGALAASHLLGLGHRRLGVVSLRGRGPAGSAGRRLPVRHGLRERALGFARTAADVPGTTVTTLEAPDNGHDEGVEAALALLRSADRPTGIFAVTDVLALAVLDVARRLRIEVPAALSVVGFDDIDAAASSQPPLTTLSQDLVGKGRAAARAALDLVAGGHPHPHRQEPHLVIRQSTGGSPTGINAGS